MFERIELTWGVAFHGLRRRYDSNDRRERGEGVISAAIAVLIMAFLGAAMWVAADARGARLSSRPTSRGASLVTLSGALIVFLMLLFFAVQLSINLYARSQVTAAGFDAARHVAGYDNDGRRDAATDEAEVRLRSMLGAMGDDVRVEWDLSDPDAVRLRLVLEPPSVAPAMVRDAAGLDIVDRTIVVRTERAR
jgi:hypothetical protein